MSDDIELIELEIPSYLNHILHSMWDSDEIIPNLLEMLYFDIEKKSLLRYEVLEILSQKRMGVLGTKKIEFDEIYNQIDKKITEYSQLKHKLSMIQKTKFTLQTNQIYEKLENKSIVIVPLGLLRLIDQFYKLIHAENKQPIYHSDLQIIDQVIRLDIFEIINNLHFDDWRTLGRDFSMDNLYGYFDKLRYTSPRIPIANHSFEGWLIRVLYTKIREEMFSISKILHISDISDNEFKNDELIQLKNKKKGLSQYRIELMVLKDESTRIRKKIARMNIQIPNLINAIIWINHEIKFNLNYKRLRDSPRGLKKTDARNSFLFEFSGLPGTPTLEETTYIKLQDQLKDIVEQTGKEYLTGLNQFKPVDKTGHSQNIKRGS